MGAQLKSCGYRAALLVACAAHVAQIVAASFSLRLCFALCPFTGRNLKVAATGLRNLKVAATALRKLKLAATCPRGYNAARLLHFRFFRYQSSAVSRPCTSRCVGA